MSEIKGLPKTLPAREIPFKFKGTGSITKHEYSGDFVVKVPSVGNQSSIGIELAKLGQGVRFEVLDRATATLNNAIAYLRVTLIEAPEWFTDEKEGMNYGVKTLDGNIPVLLFNQSQELIDKWYNALTQKSKDGKRSNS